MRGAGDSNVIGRIEGLFDTDFYLAKNADLTIEASSALEHFCLIGWRQWRNPSEAFDLWRYRTLCMDDAADENPALHFALGKAAKRVSLGNSQTITVPERARFRLRTLELLPQLATRDASVFRRIASSVVRVCVDFELAARVLQRGKAICPPSFELLVDLADIISRFGNAHEIATALNAAYAANEPTALGLYRLAELFSQQGQICEALASYERAIAGQPEPPWQWWYSYGCALTRAGDLERAENCFAKAVRAEGSDEMLRLGIGLLHERNRLWDEALTSYTARLSENGSAAELHERIAGIHAYRFDWNNCLEAADKALACSQAPKTWFWKGLALELLNRYGEAAVAFGEAARACQTPPEDWIYRHGHALMRAGKLAEACSVWGRLKVEPDEPMVEGTATELQRLLLDDRTQPAIHFGLGQMCEMDEDWSAAVQHYRNAIAIEGTHRPSWYRRLALATLACGQLEEACAAFSELRLFKRPVPALADVPFGPEAEYLEFRSTLAVDENTVLYESFAGRGLSCNPLAMFLSMLADEAYAGLIHVWAVKSLAVIPSEYRALPNVRFVPYGSTLYRRYLATAGTLINNHYFLPYFVRRIGQRYLNTWHGTPLKNLGKGVSGSYLAHKNTTRNFLQATHLISPNRHTSETLFERYDADRLLRVPVAETGYPRIDSLRPQKQGRAAALRGRLALPDNWPVVLYAPTWKGTVNELQVEANSIREVLMTLSHLRCRVVFRGHYFVEEFITGQALPVAIATADIDTCELLSIVDVLVTDYSSIFFDFLPTGRPIVHYVPDIQEYESTQGSFCLKFEDMPGRKVYDLAGLSAAAHELLSGGLSEEEKVDYERARQAFCPYEDGGSAERAVAYLFDRLKDPVLYRSPRSEQQCVLLHAGVFERDDWTDYLCRLVAALLELRFNVVICVDPWLLDGHPDRQARLARLPKDVAVLARAGFMLQSPAEAIALDRLTETGRVDSEGMMEAVSQSLRREFRRLFGELDPVAVCCLPGASSFWLRLFALGRPSESINAVLVKPFESVFAGLEIALPNLSILEECDFSGLVCAIEAASILSSTEADMRKTLGQVKDD